MAIRQHTAPVVLLGLHYSSLQIARSLVARGIPIFGIDARRHQVGSSSRYIQVLEAPSGGVGLESFLRSFAERVGDRPTLFALADQYVLFLAEHGDDLAEQYAFPRTPRAVLQALMNKTSASELLAQAGIHHPKTLSVPRNSPSRPGLENLVYPCIIKPVYKHCWQDQPIARKLLGEGQLVLTVSDATQAARAIGVLGPLSDLIVQEFIPGPSERYYYYAGYRDRFGEIAASYLGHKIRTLPDCIGSETLLRSVHLPDLLECGDSILRRFDYRGAAGIDFKYDERDRLFKVIEINCRIGINDCYLAKYGIDLPYLYYLDSRHRDAPRTRSYPAGVTWYDPIRDFEWMRLYRKRRNMRWMPWLLRLGTYDTYAVFAWSDPWPFTRSLIDLCWRGMKRLLRGTTEAAGKAVPHNDNSHPN